MENISVENYIYDGCCDYYLEIAVSISTNKPTEFQDKLKKLVDEYGI